MPTAAARARDRGVRPARGASDTPPTDRPGLTVAHAPPRASKHRTSTRPNAGVWRTAAQPCLVGSVRRRLGRHGCDLLSIELRACIALYVSACKRAACRRTRGSSGRTCSNAATAGLQNTDHCSSFHVSGTWPCVLRGPARRVRDLSKRDDRMAAKTTEIPGAPDDRWNR